MKLKRKIYKREFNKISMKFPNSTKEFKNEGAELSGNGSLIAPFSIPRGRALKEKPNQRL